MAKGLPVPPANWQANRLGLAQEKRAEGYQLDVLSIALNIDSSMPRGHPNTRIRAHGWAPTHTTHSVAQSLAQ